MDIAVGMLGPLPAVKNLPSGRPADTMNPFGKPRAGVEYSYAPARRFSSEQEAVVTAFDFIYPYSHVLNWEFGGLVCEQSGQFRLTRIVTDLTQDQVPSLSAMACGSLGTLVARFHAHPPQEGVIPSGADLLKAEQTSPVFNYLRTRQPAASISHVPPAPTQTLRFRSHPPEAPNPWAEVGDTHPSRLRAFDGATGAEQAWELPGGAITRDTNGSLDQMGLRPASVAGPIIREDGAVVLVARNDEQVSYGVFDGTRWWPVAGGSSDVRVRHITKAEGATGLTVVEVGTTLYHGNEGPIPFYFQDFRLMPDGTGSTLVLHPKTSQLLRVDTAASELSLPTALIPVTATGGGYEAEYVLGDDGAYALVNGSVNQAGVLPYWSRVVRFDPVTLAVQTVTQVDAGSQPAHLRLQFAAAGSGVLLASPSAGNKAQVAPDLWASGLAAPSLRSETYQPDANTVWSYSQGNFSSNQSLLLKKGVFAKGFPPQYGFGVFGWHYGLRITPTDQAYWANRGPFTTRDARRNYYAVFAAASSNSTCWAATLVKELNRPRDLTAVAWHAEQLPIPPEQENAAITRLVAAFDAYQNGLTYSCHPDPADGGYNSNSFATGLLDVAGLPRPAFLATFPTSTGNWYGYPGWDWPVPPIYLGVAPY